MLADTEQAAFFLSAPQRNQQGGGETGRNEEVTGHKGHPVMSPLSLSPHRGIWSADHGSLSWVLALAAGSWGGGGK